MSIGKKLSFGVYVIAWFTSGFALKAQSQPPDLAKAPVTSAVLQNAAQKGLPLTVVASVADSASLQAVLIPADLAKRIFGKEVAQNYAVIEVIISNEDANASLVVHSVFLDDSEWLLRGKADCMLDPPGRLNTSQKANLPCQVASIESRLVRGELLDAQPGTLRNWTMRSLVAAGSVAAGFAFPFSTDVVRGIAAFNGVVVPGAATLWPDGTISQINHISDFGFQTNKVIPKQGSDIIVAFFPIRRFLTPSFRKVFLKDPAALFVPGEMVADPKMVGTLESFLGPLDDSDAVDGKPVANFRGKLLKAVTRECEEGGKDALLAEKEDQNSTEVKEAKAGCQLQRLLNGISLNNVRVVLEGAMTVDVATIPATIYSVDFAADTKTLWTATGVEQTGTITGVYLTGGVPSLVDENGKAIDGAKLDSVSDASSDTLLHFTMKLTKCISSATKVFLVVNKPQSTNSKGAATTAAKQASSAVTPAKTVASTPFQLQPQPATSCAAENEDKKNESTPAPGADKGAKPAAVENKDPKHN